MRNLRSPLSPFDCAQENEDSIVTRHKYYYIITAHTSADVNGPLSASLPRSNLTLVDFSYRRRSPEAARNAFQGPLLNNPRAFYLLCSRMDPWSITLRSMERFWKNFQERHEFCQPSTQNFLCQNSSAEPGTVFECFSTIDPNIDMYRLWPQPLSLKLDIL